MGFLGLGENKGPRRTATGNAFDQAFQPGFDELAGAESEGIVGDPLAAIAAAAGTVPEREGMFGVQGPLRNILGLLGDHSLMRSGFNPIYGPIRRQEAAADRKGEVFKDFMNDPLGTFQRASQAGYTDDALGAVTAKTKADAARLSSEAAARGAATREGKAQFDIGEAMTDRALDAYYNVQSNADLKRVNDSIEANFRLRGIPLSFELPETVEQARQMGRENISAESSLRSEALAGHRATQAELAQARANLAEQRYASQQGNIARTVTDEEGNVIGLTPAGEKVDTGVKTAPPGSKGGRRSAPEAKVEGRIYRDPATGELAQWKGGRPVPITAAEARRILKEQATSGKR